MGTMGFPQEEVMKALEGQKYNEVTAIYLLLGRKSAEVCSLTLTLQSNLCLLQDSDGHQIHVCFQDGSGHV